MDCFRQSLGVQYLMDFNDVIKQKIKKSLLMDSEWNLSVTHHLDCLQVLIEPLHEQNINYYCIIM